MKDLIEKLKKIGAKRIFIQIADGLKQEILKIVNILEKNGFETIVCMENNYGACDVREYEARLFKCDTILHIGHSDFGVKTKIKTIYYEFFINKDINFKELEKINYKKIGLISSVNFIPILKRVKEYLKSIGKKVFLAKTLRYEGQITGCNISAASMIEKKVDCFLLITSGKFYALALFQKIKKPIFVFDIDKNRLVNLSKDFEKYEKIIAWNKVVLKNATNIGILVSWKKGQMFGNPFKLKKLLEKVGKKCYILAFDEISEEKLEGLKLDLLINCACPRIFPDDYEKFKLPIINYYHVFEN
ncbi:MAG: diphthamide biosynthesis enzyme Dph2 [Candidatus Aenigmarchaeota archaeon]|nr:diphthamide biosynthesis enzyme Dph2 [Candidatus Aenigmarchaeota archaeon]MDW8149718.1 diphthamide biosynthesis enzyme Dph2 [Candidatus Aenigmarchaeota archaeon]